MRDIFRKWSHNHHCIIIHHLYLYQCILLYLHLTFPHKGCHPYLCFYYAHRYLWRLHWCLKYLFLLHLWTFPFFSTSFHEVFCLLVFYFFVPWFSSSIPFSEFPGKICMYYSCNVLQISNTVTYETNKSFSIRDVGVFFPYQPFILLFDSTIISLVTKIVTAMTISIEYMFGESMDFMLVMTFSFACLLIFFILGGWEKLW